MNTTNAPANHAADQLDNALAAAGIRHFRHESNYPDNEAERNLQGRTHYADAATRRYFKARILNAYPATGNLLFVLVESVRSKPFDTDHIRRAVIFDVFGDQVNTRDQWHKTTAQADRAARDFLSQFDAPQHTREKLEKLATQLHADAIQIRQALNA
jgi:hypothetical protein